MEDVNSVYVGGLSYDSTEETVKKAFIEFGDVVSVKIVYDRESGESRGFGFVTFTNPRAATHAIREMDGGLIEGRTIRVNEVRKNNKALGFRDRDGRDTRDREARERIRRRSPPLSRGHRNRSPLPPRSRSPRPRSPRGSPRYQSPEPKERSRSLRSSVSPQSSDRKEDSTQKGGTKLSSRVAMEKEEDLRQVKDELEKARENRKELEEKVASLRGVVEKAEVTIAALHAKSQKLEDTLASALSMASQRQMQLKRLQTGVFHYKTCSEQLSNSEKEMKALAAMANLDSDHEPRVIAEEVDMAFMNGVEEPRFHNTELFSTT